MVRGTATDAGDEEAVDILEEVPHLSMAANGAFGVIYGAVGKKSRNHLSMVELFENEVVPVDEVDGSDSFFDRDIIQGRGLDGWEVLVYQEGRHGDLGQEIESWGCAGDLLGRWHKIKGEIILSLSRCSVLSFMITELPVKLLPYFLGFVSPTYSRCCLRHCVAEAGGVVKSDYSCQCSDFML